jgi:DNA-binding response OmpR family regulator
VRKKILVADDDASIREILAIQLARMGYEIVLAEDGEEAVAAYEKESPNLVVMDVMMPRLNGLEACQRIRALEKKLGKRVPVIFLTARDTTHDKTTAALSGGDEFVSKPVSLQELRERVEAALNKKAKP